MAISLRPSVPLRLEKDGKENDAPLPEGLLPPGGTGAIILSKFSGWGSLVTILPLLDALRTHAPHAPIILLTQEKNAELASTFSQVTRTLYIPSPAFSNWIRHPLSFFKKIREIRKLRPVAFIDLQLHTHQSPVRLLSFLSGATIRLGFTHRKGLLPGKTLTHSLTFNKHQPLPLAFGQIAHLLGLGTLSHSPKIPLILSSREKDRALAKLGITDRKKHLLVVNPNASPQGLERRWPRELFSMAIEAFLRKHPETQVVLIGAAGERDYVEPIRKALFHRPQTIKNAAGHLTLQETAALLKQATLFVTNDSGPLHLGLALGTPTVALFGPTHPDLVLYRPNAPKSTFLYQPAPCSPCLHHTEILPCGGDNHCLQSISVDSVLTAMEGLIAPGRKEESPQQWRFNPERYAPLDSHPSFPFPSPGP